MRSGLPCYKASPPLPQSAPAVVGGPDAKLGGGGCGGKREGKRWRRGKGSARGVGREALEGRGGEGGVGGVGWRGRRRRRGEGSVGGTVGFQLLRPPLSSWCSLLPPGNNFRSPKKCTVLALLSFLSSSSYSHLLSFNSSSFYSHILFFPSSIDSIRSISSSTSIFSLSRSSIFSFSFDSTTVGFT